MPHGLHHGAALAQPVEHIIRNDGVACSSHASGTSFLPEINECITPRHRVDWYFLRGPSESGRSPLLNTKGSSGAYDPAMEVTYDIQCCLGAGKISQLKHADTISDLTTDTPLFSRQ